MTYLIELEHVEQFEQFLVLLVLLQIDVVLLQSVQRQLGLIVDVHLHGLDLGNRMWRILKDTIRRGTEKSNLD